MNKQIFIISILLFLNSPSFAMVWIDLETTGLDPETDVILKIATIVTDNQLNIIEEGPTFVIQQPEQVLESMSSWAKQHHDASGLTEKIREQGIPIEQAHEGTLEFIMRHCAKGESPLCGTNPKFDKSFMIRYMPKIVDFLHYRIIDVLVVHRLIALWYPNDPNNKSEKKFPHRALDDIRESIAELRHYRKHFFISDK